MDKYRLLVVDDDEKWRKKPEEILSDKFEIDEATNLEEAKKKIIEKDPPYHVVLTDIRLQDGDPTNIDGVQIAEFVKNECRGATRVIMWTAYASVETAIRSMKLKAMDYFEKNPVNRDGKSLAFDDRRDEFKNRIVEVAEQVKQTLFEKRILVIDDDEDWKDKFYFMLRDRGFKVDMVDSENAIGGMMENLDYKSIIVDPESFPDEGKRQQFFDSVLQKNPETKVIIVSETDDVKFVRDAFVDYRIFNFYFKDNFDETAFTSSIETIFYPENLFFIVSELERKNGDYSLILKTERFKKTKNKNVISLFMSQNATVMTIEVIPIIMQDEKYVEIYPDRDFLKIDPNTDIDNQQPIAFKITRTSKKIPKNKDILISTELFSDNGSYRQMNEITLKYD